MTADAWFGTCLHVYTCKPLRDDRAKRKVPQFKQARLDLDILKNAMDLETLWYELSPYLYAVCGVFSLSYGPGSWLLIGSGILLIIAALTIVRLRWIYRRALYLKIETAASALKKARDQDQGLLWEEERQGG